MSVSKAYSHRRAASSFINDAGDINLIQLSPRKEQRSPFTMTSNHESRTNFIGDSIIPTEIPRAFAVTKTGEKHVLDLEVSSPPRTNSYNPFTLPSPRFSEPTLEKISEKSASDYSLSAKDRMTRSSGKLNKRAKAVKCNVNKKHRLVFTPRNMDNNSSAEMLSHTSVHDERANVKPLRTEPLKTVTRNTSAQTETDNVVSGSCSSYKSRPYNNTPISNNNSRRSVPSYNYSEPLMTDALRSQSFYRSPVVDFPQYEPLKIYTKTNPNLRKYSELRAIASVITLITVISWLFSTFFDVDCLWDYCNSLWEYFRNLFFVKEKPKTKLEILVEFIKDLFS